MTETIPAIGGPKRMLLATDLSASSDRATERAVSLAAAWGAELVAVHALRPRHADAEMAYLGASAVRPDPATIARTLRQDLAAAGNVALPVIREGEPDELVLEIAAERRCDLIVLGLDRTGPLGSSRLGGPLKGLLRSAAAPVLVVKDRVRAPYANVIAATDFSTASRQALQAALALFPDLSLTVFHAYDAPMASLVQDPVRYRNAFRDRPAAECEAFLEAAGLTAERRADVSRVIESGDPAVLLRALVVDLRADLVVIGTHGRSALLDTLIGGTAKAILSIVPCDALVVPIRKAD